ncbi:MAG TPA: tRNA (adenosine(37)-N6)-threonylcarbamoyltransferase complex transferase subunit TsaD [Aggregatilineales bacterium]|nr:tRNA (adenosine(37)-N6)-threonylcarbamoyltransferase complex transferase subunit TsaD [Aggregatilineales bacterium]
MSLIFGIETSCDETAAAVVENGQSVLSNIVASQVDLHAQYGGIFPEVASRAHIEAITVVAEQALSEAAKSLPEMDAIAVTYGPGLPGSLLVGVNYAKGLSLGAGLPLIAVNHLEGHLYSLWTVEPERPIQFPVVALIVSGGHTELVLMKNHGEYIHLGGTIDDAAGEAFDKVGRLLELPYPGGPAIQKAAENGDPNAYHFPRSLPDSPYDFSFSGLKTSVMRTVRPPIQGKIQPGAESLIEGEIRSGIDTADVAASFQAAVVDVLVTKTLHAAQAFGATEILLAGGVSANRELRAEFFRRSDLPLRIPPLPLCTDNAAMIAAAGYFRYKKGDFADFSLDIKPNLPLT